MHLSPESEETGRIQWSSEPPTRDVFWHQLGRPPRSLPNGPEGAGTLVLSIQSMGGDGGSQTGLPRGDLLKYKFTVPGRTSKSDRDKGRTCPFCHITPSKNLGKCVEFILMLPNRIPLFPPLEKLAFIEEENINISSLEAQTMSIFNEPKPDSLQVTSLSFSLSWRYSNQEFSKSPMHHTHLEVGAH